MPEGDTIFRLADRLSKVLTHKVVRAFEAHVIRDDVAKTIVGHTVAAVEARGKNLLVRFDDGRALHVHLRMLGRVFVERTRGVQRSRMRSRSPQLRLEVDGAIVTGHRIPVLRLLTRVSEARAPDLAGLGPDILADAFDAAEVLRRFRTLGRREIGDALLLQRAVAGIGNVYKSEVLFLEHIDPKARLSTLPDDVLLGALDRARTLMKKNLGGGPRTTRSTLSGARLWLYGRAGKPCFVCTTPIEAYRQGAPPGRITYHCPVCQPAAAE